MAFALSGAFATAQRHGKKTAAEGEAERMDVGVTFFSIHLEIVSY